MKALKSAVISNIQKDYFNKRITDVQCFHRLKLYLGSWHKASQTFQTLWMEKP